MREDFKLDTCPAYDGGSIKMSPSIDGLSSALWFMRTNLAMIMDMLIVCWCAIRMFDANTPSYVRTAVELKRALGNLINAVEGVMLWMTGGCTVRPIFNLKACDTFEDWFADAFSDVTRDMGPNTRLRTALQEIQAKTEEINMKIPYIYLSMQHVREEHGNDVSFLISPNLIKTCGFGEKEWLERCDMLRSMDLLRDSLGIDGRSTPIPWLLAHIEHLLKETIPLVQCRCTDKH